MEIVNFSTCPWTSKNPKCSCPEKISLVPKNKLAYTLQCLNNLFFNQIYINFVNSIDPDQLASNVNSVDPDQLASEEAS